MKIIDIRNTQSHGWIADVLLSPLSVLPVSIPVMQCTSESMIEYVNSDKLHIRYGKPRLNKVIVSKSFADRWSNSQRDYRNYYHTNCVVII